LAQQCSSEARLIKTERAALAEDRNRLLLWYSHTPMTEKNTERRTQKRIPTRVPVTIKSTEGGVQTTGYTRDLSSSGVFLYADADINAGSELEIVLVLPPELTNGEKRWACCQASVARVENKGDGSPLGVAATIRRFELLPEIPS
jgi:hypothetical protein